MNSKVTKARPELGMRLFIALLAWTGGVFFEVVRSGLINNNLDAFSIIVWVALGIVTLYVILSKKSQPYKKEVN